MTVEFKYDHNGLRTQKKVTSGGEVTVTDYTLHGKLVTHLTRGSDEMHFFYDAQSRPVMWSSTAHCTATSTTFRATLWESLTAPEASW